MLHNRIKNKIILALDTENRAKAEDIIAKTSEYVGFYKIGMGFLAHHGIDFAKDLVKNNFKVFLDLKLFDIGQTITDAVARLADTGVHIMTVHGDPYVVSAAVKGRVLSGRKDLDIYAVTVLTNLDAEDVKSAGYSLPPQELALERARHASIAGADGVISSGHECRLIKSAGYGLKVITPGIRSQGISSNDQKRVMTPVEALQAGADYLVIGREVTKASDATGVISHIIHEIIEAKM